MAKAKSAPATEFKCPECDRTFDRASALGAHRSRAHGVVGKRRDGRAAPLGISGGDTHSRTRPSNRTRAARPSRAARSNGHVDHDALLKVMFPQGIPPRESVISSVNVWLAEADRLVAA